MFLTCSIGVIGRMNVRNVTNDRLFSDQKKTKNTYKIIYFSNSEKEKYLKYNDQMSLVNVRECLEILDRLK